jgi:HAE1 family hydrophobic/amphiphilic exporter-1
MNISAPFIQRPIATALLMVGLLVGGLVAYPLLPVASLPNINYPTLTVTAQFPGADPQTMASSVAAPLELQFGEIPGLTQMTSASALGYTQITLQFELSRPIDGAVADTLSAINAATAYLPVGIPYPPQIRKVNPADTPILVLGMTSDTLPITVVDAYAQNIMLQKISQISGVGLVGVGGEQHSGYPAPARRQRRRDRAADQGDDAYAPGIDPGRCQSKRHFRSHPDHPRVDR